MEGSSQKIYTFSSPLPANIFSSFCPKLGQIIIGNHITRKKLVLMNTGKLRSSKDARFGAVSNLFKEVCASVK